MLLLLAVQ